MVLKLEKSRQGLSFMDVSSELLKQGIRTSVASQDTILGVRMNPIPNKRERRPGLDRKRGHFTFKPTISQPPQNEPTFDGSKYPKPEDYFAAYERYQNAKREWQKQTGNVVTDTHQNQPSRSPRRPGIPGRKRGSYQHTCTDTYFTDLNASEKENLIPSEQSVASTSAANVMSADVDDSTVDTDKDLENVLTKLRAYSPDELEGSAGVKLFEVPLHIKPIDKPMLSLPKFPGFRRMDLKACGRNTSNRRSARSYIESLIKGVNSNETRKNRQLSPNPPEDQFSFPDRNYLLPGDQQSREVDQVRDLNVCFRSSVANNTDKVITNASPSNVGNVYVCSPLNRSVQKSSYEDGSGTHSIPDGSTDNCVGDSITKGNSATLEVNVDMQTNGNEVEVSISESEANRTTSRRENNADINEQNNKLDCLAEYASRVAARMNLATVEEDSILYQQDKSSKSPNRAPEQYNTMDGSFEHAEKIQGKHGEENDNTDNACGSQEVHNSSNKQTSKRRKRRSCNSNMKKRRKTVHDEGAGDKQIKTLSHENGAKKQTKRKSNDEEEKKQKKRVTREGKIFSRRESLAAASTKWESGVRRSTRIKSRPLEHWRGERFLFGRIHESLTTVIGVKYASPDKGNNIVKRVLKVKSFVSDDYKELIDLAALH